MYLHYTVALKNLFSILHLTLDTTLRYQDLKYDNTNNKKINNP